MHPLITKWFWAICILVAFANAALFWMRARKKIAAQPELKRDYLTIIRGFVVYGSIPWAIVGIGVLSRQMPTSIHVVRPRDGNPFVLAFYASFFILWFATTHWIFFRGGAQQLANCSDIWTWRPNPLLQSARAVKAWWILCSIGAFFAVIMAFVQTTPLPE